MPEVCAPQPDRAVGVTGAGRGQSRNDLVSQTLSQTSLGSVARRLPFFYGWVIVAVAFVTMALSVNARTAFSLLFPPILNQFGWARGVTAGAFSFGFLVTAFTSPLLGWMMDRHGPRIVIEISVALVAAGLILATLIRSRGTST